jgi:hypothetical protein
MLLKLERPLAMVSLARALLPVWASGVLLIAHPVASATIEEGCRAYSLIAKQTALLRDQGESASTVRARMAAAGIPDWHAERLVDLVFLDWGRLEPDAVEYAINALCLENPDFLAQR